MTPWRRLRTTAEELAKEHWKYTEMIILDMLKLTEDMYNAAMIHGLKHNAEKFKAIKKLVEKGPHPHDNLEDYQQAVDDWLGKMMNVLEGEA